MTNSVATVISLQSSDRVADEHVRCSDVLGSNSKRATQHPGTKSFKALVAQRADEYERADKGMDERDKGTGKRTRGIIIDEIIHIITQQNDGRFLTWEDNQWVVMRDPKTIRHKVGQALKKSRTSHATSTTATLPERVIVATASTSVDKDTQEPTKSINDQLLKTTNEKKSTEEYSLFAMEYFDNEYQMRASDNIHDNNDVAGDDEPGDDRSIASIMSSDSGITGGITDSSMTTHRTMNSRSIHALSVSTASGLGNENAVDQRRIMNLLLEVEGHLLSFFHKLEAGINNVHVVSGCLTLLSSTCSSLPKEAWAQAGANGGISVLIQAIKRHPLSLAVQLEGSKTIYRLMMMGDMVPNDSLRAYIGHAGGIDCILRAMRLFPRNEDVQKYGCWVIGSLLFSTSNENQSMIGANDDVLFCILEAMRQFPNNEYLQRGACCAISTLATNHEGNQNRKIG